MNLFNNLWRVLAILSPILLCGIQYAQAGLTLSSTNVQLDPKGKVTLTISGAEGKVSVSSSNSKVVKAKHDSGKLSLEAKAKGTASILVRDKTSSAMANITVVAASPVPLSVTPSSVTLAPGGKSSLTVSNVNGTLRAASANTKIIVAQISNGLVMLEAKAAGSTTLKISDSKTSVTVPVTVNSSGGTSAATGTYTLLAWNDLGMHCMDGDYSVFSILPPYNNLHAQLVNSSTNKLVTSGVTLTYEAMADADGSINTISSTKTNFWQYAKSYFGVDLMPDTGLTGKPTVSLTPAPMTFEAASGQFKAEGIPITPYDDSQRKNYYPMVKVVAKDSTGKQLAQARVVLPVSDEMSCAACHASNSDDTAKPVAGWVTGEANQEREYKKNILRLHDEKQSGNTRYINALASKGYLASGLTATAESGKPILCASCHASNALPGTGITGIKPLTEAIHSKHSMVKDASGQPLESITNRSACYQCHPGSETKCLRGVMGNAVLTDGKAAMDCQSCHGPMSKVGRSGRVGWLDQPNCQACHHDGKRELAAVTNSGLLKVWLDNRYATNPNVPGTGFSLYRFSKGHGNLQCEACHGATHAEYPSSHRNDNVLSQDIQGREGTIGECSACHKTVPMTATGGPHGMHTVGSSWVSGHESYAKSNSTSCAYCHGADYRGGILSTVKKARTFSAEGKTVSYAAGQKVGCYDCHNGPRGD